MPVGVDKNRITAALVDSVYPGDESGCLIRLVTDADGVGLAGNAEVGNVDIEIADGEMLTGDITQCNVVAARSNSI